LLADDQDVFAGDQETDGLVLEGSADPNVVEAAEVAEADGAALVDAVVTDAEVDGRRGNGRPGFDAGAPGPQRGFLV
jgi:hypothetical protein